jgi:hypothetical protein
MRRFEVLALLGAMLLAAVMLLPLVAGSDEPVGVAAEPVNAPPPVAAVVDVTVPEPPSPLVPSLPDAVADVLASNGHTEFMSSVELETQLPPAVLALLIERDVVLRVAEGEPAP